MFSLPFRKALARARAFLHPRSAERRLRPEDGGSGTGRLPAGDSPSLRALTAAALALPGLAPSAGAAEGDDVAFQYGSYNQSQFQLADGVKTQYSPLRVATVSANGGFTFFDRWKFAFNYIQDTWSGATPVASAPVALGGNNVRDGVSGASPLISGNNSLFYDGRLTPYRQSFDPETGEGLYAAETRIQQTIASASPETRDQGDFRLGYEWDEAAVNVSGGVSNERDYHSAFGGVAGRLDLNQKLTTLNLGLNYNHSDINALLNPESLPYYDYSFYTNQLRLEPGAYGTELRYLEGTRQDWSTRFSVAQVLGRNSVLEAGAGYVRSSGYLGNPYKLVDFVFVDTSEAPSVAGGDGLPALWQADVQGVLERRPDLRNQGTWDLKLVQYVEGFDAAVHLGYRFFHDDWGIHAHTFDADWGQPLGDGWTVTPHFRYYSQDAADFYRPYFLFNQAAPANAEGAFNLAGVPLNAYSSDYRLGAFGAVSGGITVSKKANRALTFLGSFDYYARRSDLAFGNGSGSFADFNFYAFNASVKVDLSAAASGFSEALGHAGHEHHHHGHGHGHGSHAPAGVMFSHTLNKAGDFMVGYRFMYSLQDGPMLRGDTYASDAEIVAGGCGGVPCSYAPERMSMNMHMIDLMYAPTDWLTLMLMPQFMSMDMTLRPLEGGAPPPSGEGESHNHGGNPDHGSGGVGDTGMYALFKLFEAPGHQVVGSLGFTAPTGSVKVKINGNSIYDHYGMQLGSGTWDFRPSLTYGGNRGRVSWGAQLTGTVPMQARNESGYALGNLFQASAWGSYQILHWLSASVRGVYTLQGSISGQFDPPQSPVGPMDMPGSYGGRFWDMGFGLNAVVPEGAFAGNQFGIEWLQPIHDDPNGIQLERTGSLFATWSIAF
jgi:hypothetical protein